MGIGASRKNSIIIQLRNIYGNYIQTSELFVFGSESVNFQRRFSITQHDARGQ